MNKTSGILELANSTSSEVVGRTPVAAICSTLRAFSKEDLPALNSPTTKRAKGRESWVRRGVRSIFDEVSAFSIFDRISFVS